MYDLTALTLCFKLKVFLHKLLIVSGLRESCTKRCAVPYKEQPIYSGRRRTVVPRTFHCKALLTAPRTNIRSMHHLSTSTPELLPRDIDRASTTSGGSDGTTVNVQRPSHESASLYLDSASLGNFIIIIIEFFKVA